MVEEGEEEGEEGEGERKSAQTKFYDRSKFSRSKISHNFQNWKQIHLTNLKQAIAMYES